MSLYPTTVDEAMHAQHLMFSTYGFWLPNDPRGSGSTRVWSPALRKHGPPTFTDSSRSVAAQTHDRQARLRAKTDLQYPRVILNGRQARAVGRGLRDRVHRFELRIFACAIMPDHVHLAVAKHDKSAEYVIGMLKRAATRQLTKEQLHPLAGHCNNRGRTPTPWSEHGWWVFLNSESDVLRTIRYVENNPRRAGLPVPKWPFVVPFRS